MKKIINITMMLLMSVALFSCKKSEAPAVELKLKGADAIEMKVNEVTPVTIESGNGEYKATSSDDKVATATISGNTISIKGNGQGSATITVTDAQKKSATIKVTVTYAVPNEFKMIWEGMSLEFDKADAHAITLLSSGIAVSDVVKSNKQYFFSWQGGYGEGQKSGGKMIVVEKGKEPQNITLTELVVAQNTTDGTFILFEGGNNKKGWIRFKF